MTCRAYKHNWFEIDHTKLEAPCKEHNDRNCIEDGCWVEGFESVDLVYFCPNCEEVKHCHVPLKETE